MDPNIALVALLNAIQSQDVEAYFTALDDLHSASAQTGKLPVMPANAGMLLWCRARVQDKILAVLRSSQPVT